MWRGGGRQREPVQGPNWPTYPGALASRNTQRVVWEAQKERQEKEGLPEEASQGFSPGETPFFLV